MHQLALRLIAKAQASDDPNDEPLRALDWWYPEDGKGDPKMEAVLAEINGRKTNPVWRACAEGRGCQLRRCCSRNDRHGQPHHGPQLDKYQELKDDGTTACGCWIYCGVYGRDGVNKALARRA